MSDLVEKVARAVEAASAEHAFDSTYNGEARAAIKAVAEWVKDECEYQWGEDRNSATAQQTVLDVVADLLAQLEDKP